MPVSAVVEPTRDPNMSTPWKCTFLHVSSASCSIARVQSMKALCFTALVTSIPGSAVIATNCPSILIWICTEGHLHRRASPATPGDAGCAGDAGALADAGAVCAGAVCAATPPPGTVSAAAWANVVAPPSLADDAGAGNASSSAAVATGTPSSSMTMVNDTSSSSPFCVRSCSIAFK